MKTAPIPPKRNYKNRLESGGINPAGAGFQAARKANKIDLPPTNRLLLALLDMQPDVIIGQDVEIRGIFQFEGLLRLDGRFQGSLESTGDVIVGPRGVLVADLTSIKRLVVDGGTVVGKMSVEQLGIAGNAVLRGDIACKHMEVDGGDVKLEGGLNVHPFAPALLEEEEEGEGGQTLFPYDVENTWKISNSILVLSQPQDSPPRNSNNNSIHSNNSIFTKKTEKQTETVKDYGDTKSADQSSVTSLLSTSTAITSQGVQTGDGVQALRRERLKLREQRREERRRQLLGENGVEEKESRESGEGEIGEWGGSHPVAKGEREETIEVRERVVERGDVSDAMEIERVVQEKVGLVEGEGEEEEERGALEETDEPKEEEERVGGEQEVVEGEEERVEGLDSLILPPFPGDEASLGERDDVADIFSSLEETLQVGGGAIIKEEREIEENKQQGEKEQERGVIEDMEGGHEEREEAEAVREEEKGNVSEKEMVEGAKGIKEEVQGEKSVRVEVQEGGDESKRGEESSDVVEEMSVENEKGKVLDEEKVEGEKGEIAGEIVEETYAEDRGEHRKEVEGDGESSPPPSLRYIEEVYNHSPSTFNPPV